MGKGLPDAKLVELEPLRNVSRSQTFGCEHLNVPDEHDVGGKARRDAEGIPPLELRLGGGEERREVTLTPGVRQRPGGGLARRGGKHLDLVTREWAPSAPRGELV